MLQFYVLTTEQHAQRTEMPPPARFSGRNRTVPEEQRSRHCQALWLTPRSTLHAAHHIYINCRKVHGLLNIFPESLQDRLLKIASVTCYVLSTNLSEYLELGGIKVLGHLKAKFSFLGSF